MNEGLVKLGYWMYKKNMNASQLSKKAKVDINTVISIKNGVNYATVRTLEKLANALEIEITDLFKEGA